MTRGGQGKDYTEKRKVAGLKIGKLDGVDLYWYSYPPAYTKAILDKPAITFKELAGRLKCSSAASPSAI